VEITDVRVYPVREDKLKAFVSVVFDRCFMVNDIKVIQGKDGLFISMPSRRKKNGDFKDIAHPLNQETRRWVEERILQEYRGAIEGGAPAPAAAAQPEAEAEAGEPSLEEVERLHLNDSFWGVS
jgi:stage V sporulation protein G